MTYEYHATAINVVDGDTLDVCIDLGFRITMVQRVRLYGIDTPEHGTPGGAEATVALRDFVFAHDTILPTLLTPLPLTICTVKPHDKYGRWLATISAPTCPDVAEAMIAAGFGVPYFGGKKQ